MWYLVTNMHVESFILQTALCKIHDDLVSNTCRGKASILVLLDLSTVFDTVDHRLLLSHFSDCGVEGTALSFLESYLENREQSVAIGESRSEPTALLWCSAGLCPWSSIVYSVHWYLLFFWKLMELVITFFADNTQLYIMVEDIDEAKHRLLSLMYDLKLWMARRKLKLNDGKPEIIVIRGNLGNVL